MTSDRPLDESAHIAQQALDRMRRDGVPPTPENFTVWYHYFARSFPDLNRAIDVVVNSHADISGPIMGDLFTRFFGATTSGDPADDVAARLDDVMQRAAQDLTAAGDGAAEFGSALTGATGALDADPSGTDAHQVVRGIVAATRKMEARARELEQRLEDASQEVTELRAEMDRMRRDATTDGLTGLANRKQFDTKLQEEAAEAEESGEPLCLLMLDIDHFKRFNDDHGHQAGDQVLRLLGEILRQCVKGQDTAARYGGEEFSIILPRTGLKQGSAVAEAVRHKVSRKTIVNRATGRQLGSITLSIGIAQYRPGETIAHFLGRADAALYLAKDLGRDRVVSELDHDTQRLAIGS